MCIFSGNAEVSGTRIFSRLNEDNKQFLAYQMTFSAKEPLAMILPIPVNVQSEEDCEFKTINLEKYPIFFDDIDILFITKNVYLSRSFNDDDCCSMDTLAIQKVGCYDLSFVPKFSDFDRLDKRFRLPEIVKSISEYEKYSFVVCQLREGSMEIHPIAFEFKSSNREKTFFPTIHVHNGTMPETEEFDHTLYAQTYHDRIGMESWNIQNTEIAKENTKEWYEWSGPVSLYDADQNLVDKSLGLIDKDYVFWKRNIKGDQENKDIWF